MKTKLIIAALFILFIVIVFTPASANASQMSFPEEASESEVHQSLAHEDSDGDGCLDLTEIEAGSSPQDATSLPLSFDEYSLAAPDGDPRTGVPVGRTTLNFETSRVPDLIEVDRLTGEKIADFSVPTQQALTQEQMSAILRVEALKEATVDPSEIRFRSGYSVHPAAGMELSLSQTISRSESSSYLVIQFGRSVDRQILDDLEDLGIVFYDYVPYHAYYAEAPLSSLDRLQALLRQGTIRYVGAIPSAAKIDESFLREVSENPGKSYQVAIEFFPSESSEYEQILDQFIEVFSSTDDLVIGRLYGNDIQAIYQKNTVRWVEEWITPELFNLDGRMFHGADCVAGLTGRNVNVAVFDTGIAQEEVNGVVEYHPSLPGHRIVDEYDFQNSDTIAEDDDGHGTLVAGSIGGSGAMVPAWSGMAPNVDFSIYKMGQGDDQFSWFQEALERAAEHDVDVINNSWGTEVQEYNILSELADRAVRGEFGKPMTLVFAAGNDDTILGGPANAKNAITVGAVTDGNDDFLPPFPERNWPPGDKASFSSFGPVDTDDDQSPRVKPDVVSTGIRTVSTYPWYFSSEPYFHNFVNGTSIAAAKVTGIIALMLQQRPWTKIHPEIVKADMIATAMDLGNTDYFGHGVVDVSHLFHDEPGVMERIISIFSRVDSNYDSKTYTFQVPSGAEEVRVVLTWLDPPGREEAINDLDLYVYDALGKPQGISASSDDVIEKVIATTGAPGLWTMTVDPFDLGQPHQDFAVTVYAVMKPPNLDLFAKTSHLWVKPGDIFRLHTFLSNNDGRPVAASYIELNAPDGRFFRVAGADLYTSRDDLSHYYFASNMHTSPNPDLNEFFLGTGEVATCPNRHVVWHIYVDPDADYPTDTLFYAKGYAHNGLSTSTKSVSVRIDDSHPTGSILINNGEWETNTRKVILFLSATDTISGVADMRFSDNGRTWSPWERYKIFRPYTLPLQGDYERTVWVQYRDKAGNTSQKYTDSIYYFPFPPRTSESE